MGTNSLKLKQTINDYVTRSNPHGDV